MSKSEAIALTEDLKQIAAESNWYEVGRKLKKGLDEGAPIVMESGGAGKWLTTFGEKIGKFRRYLRSVKALECHPPEVLTQLLEGNAYNLACLPEEIRRSEEWLNKALTLSHEDFTAAVNEKKGIKPEQWYTAFPKMPISFEPIGEEFFRIVAEILEIDIELEPKMKFKVMEIFCAAFVNASENDLANFRDIVAELLGQDDGSLPPPEVE